MPQFCCSVAVKHDRLTLNQHEAESAKQISDIFMFNIYIWAFPTMTYEKKHSKCSTRKILTSAIITCETTLY